VTGVALARLLGSPCPTAFTVLTRKSYKSAFERPVTVAVVKAEVPSANIDQEESVESLYSTT
jgi:hypothetical protein